MHGVNKLAASLTKKTNKQKKATEQKNSSSLISYSHLSILSPTGYVHRVYLRAEAEGDTSEDLVAKQASYNNKANASLASTAV